MAQRRMRLSCMGDSLGEAVGVLSSAIPHPPPATRERDLGVRIRGSRVMTHHYSSTERQAERGKRQVVGHTIVCECVCVCV